jgi:hypothetical protein
MVTLIYHRQLDDAWADAARRLRERLRMAAAEQEQQQQQQEVEGQDGIKQQRAVANGSGDGGRHADALHVIGRSRKQKLALDHDFVTERLAVNGRQLAYK